VRCFINCRAYAFDPVSRHYRRCDSFLVEDGRFVALDAQAGVGIETIDLGGATVVPAFSDCHVHLTDTGYTLGARDLSGVRDARAFAARIAALPRDEEVLYAANYDEARWVDGAIASAAPLEREFADRLAMLVRVDGHSSLVNRHTLADLGLAPSLEGIERDAGGAPTGRLFLTANWTAQARFLAKIPSAQRRAADHRAHALALAQGALHLHVQLIGLGSREAYAAEIAALRELGAAKWHPKVCERDPALAQSLGLPYIGGDVFLDGSLGSGTAALREPYCDRPGNGNLTLNDDEVFAYFAEAEALGISAGVHAIGDRAIEQCIAAWERVLGGRPSARNRHFIEHFELATPDQIARCVRLGIFLSMQPQFDAVWGAPGGMYETRLGSERSRSMNALRSALDAGAVLCGGDDSPVCPLSPISGMGAACEHNVTGERLSPLEALTMYTYDAARLAHAEGTTGALAPGLDADFVVLDRDPFDGAPFAQTQVLETWMNGTRVYSVDAPSAA
jgi:predicted amidohydrolase YtcJ